VAVASLELYLLPHIDNFNHHESITFAIAAIPQAYRCQVVILLLERTVNFVLASDLKCFHLLGGCRCLFAEYSH